MIVSEPVSDRYLAGEMSDTAAKELDGFVRQDGGAACPENDSDGTVQPTEDCAMWAECFHSQCA